MTDVVSTCEDVATNGSADDASDVGAGLRRGMKGSAPSSTRPSDFQHAVTEALLRVMQAKRPDVLWSAVQPDEIRESVADPDNFDTFPDGATRTAA